MADNINLLAEGGESRVTISEASSFSATLEVFAEDVDGAVNVGFKLTRDGLLGGYQQSLTLDVSALDYPASIVDTFDDAEAQMDDLIDVTQFSPGGAQEAVRDVSAELSNPTSEDFSPPETEDEIIASFAPIRYAVPANRPTLPLFENVPERFDTGAIPTSPSDYGLPSGPVEVEVALSSGVTGEVLSDLAPQSGTFKIDPKNLIQFETVTPGPLPECLLQLQEFIIGNTSIDLAAMDSLGDNPFDMEAAVSLPAGCDPRTGVGAKLFLNGEPYPYDGGVNVGAGETASIGGISQFTDSITPNKLRELAGGGDTLDIQLEVGDLQTDIYTVTLGEKPVPAALELVESVLPNGPFSPGSSLPFEFTVENTGTKSGQYELVVGEQTLDVATIGGGETATLSGQYTPQIDGEGIVDLTASIPNTGISESVSINFGGVTPGEPNFSVDGIINPPEVAPGDSTAIIEIPVKNEGGDGSLTIDGPSGSTSYQVPGESSKTVTYSVGGGSLPDPGRSESVNLTLSDGAGEQVDDLSVPINSTENLIGEIALDNFEMGSYGASLAREWGDIDAGFVSFSGFLYFRGYDPVADTATFMFKNELNQGNTSASGPLTISVNGEVRVEEENNILGPDRFYTLENVPAGAEIKLKHVVKRSGWANSPQERTITGTIPKIPTLSVGEPSDDSTIYPDIVSEATLPITNESAFSDDVEVDVFVSGEKKIDGAKIAQGETANLPLDIEGPSFVGSFDETIRVEAPSVEAAGQTFTYTAARKTVSFEASEPVADLTVEERVAPKEQPFPNTPVEIGLVAENNSPITAEFDVIVGGDTVARNETIPPGDAKEITGATAVGTSPQDATVQLVSAFNDEVMAAESFTIEPKSLDADDITLTLPDPPEVPYGEPFTGQVEVRNDGATEVRAEIFYETYSPDGSAETASTDTQTIQSGSTASYDIETVAPFTGGQYDHEIQVVEPSTGAVRKSSTFTLTSLAPSVTLNGVEIVPPDPAPFSDADAEVALRNTGAATAPLSVQIGGSTTEIEIPPEGGEAVTRTLETPGTDTTFGLTVTDTKTGRTVIDQNPTLPVNTPEFDIEAVESPDAPVEQFTDTDISVSVVNEGSAPGPVTVEIGDQVVADGVVVDPETPKAFSTRIQVPSQSVGYELLGTNVATGEVFYEGDIDVTVFDPDEQQPTTPTPPEPPDQPSPPSDGDDDPYDGVFTYLDPFGLFGTSEQIDLSDDG